METFQVLKTGLSITLKYGILNWKYIRIINIIIIIIPLQLIYMLLDNKFNKMIFFIGKKVVKDFICIQIHMIA